MQCADAISSRAVIIDTEAVAAPREHQKRVLRNEGDPEQSVEEMLTHEFRHLFMAEKIVAVNKKDAEILKENGFPNVGVLGHMQKALPHSPGWDARRDILFLGAMHDIDSPNVDSLAWFSSQVLPLLDGRLPDDVKFTVCGYINPKVDLKPLTKNPRVNLLGRVPDVGPVYDRHRIFVAPTRFAAGIPYKIHEAAAHGLPIVASSILCEQVGWTPGEDMLSVSTTDPQAFADAIVRLYEDKVLWESIREHELARMRDDHSHQKYLEQLKALLSF
ncbi:glycosyltransferase family 4 protein [Acetobacter cerevisiae]|uniref:Glycosyl transferase n=1 Tax=Acetobacter cerevisiae TaxID=178900 RepID=A0A149QRP9_9PROT|nr:glycosyltransferase family 4 protein [Acetobacter cerevisiae]KXU99971.1 hypothetical protein AD928_02120 [Acetobacter cerevisiae]GBQ05831.1 hypothetical protein AA14362_0580 [Acetobacter cerevisiae DSM 14362]